MITKHNFSIRELDDLNWYIDRYFWYIIYQEYGIYGYQSPYVGPYLHIIEKMGWAIHDIEYMLSCLLYIEDIYSIVELEGDAPNGSRLIITLSYDH